MHPTHPQGNDYYAIHIDMLPVAVIEIDGNLNLTVANQRALQLFDYTDEDILQGLNGLDLLATVDRARAREYFLICLQGQESEPIECQGLKKDGTQFPIRLQVQSFLDTDQRPSLKGIIFDITKYKQTEKALIESEQSYRQVYQNSVAGIYRSTPQGRFTSVNPALAKMLRYDSPEDLIGTITDIASQIYADPEDRRRFQQAIAQKGRVDRFEFKARCKDDTQIWLSTSTRAYFDQNGQITHYEGISIDVSDSLRAEELTQIRMRLLECAQNQSFDDLLSHTLNEAEQLVDSPISFFHFVGPDQKSLRLQAWSTGTLEKFCQAIGKGLHYDINQAGVWVDCVRQRRPVIHNDYDSLPHKKGMPEGHATLIRELVVPIFREDRIVAILGVGNKPQEYTDQDVESVTRLADMSWEIIQSKRADEEQKSLQNQLFQIQKSEAIGTLAGGIAHDFNNLLMGIQGRASLMAMDLSPSQPEQEHIAAIEKYIRSATNLTKQLLGLARGGKYEVNPIELNELVLDSIEMFGRTHKQIRIHTSTQPETLVVEADKRQLEQVLLNLYVNGWQAMPKGGELFVKTALIGLDQNTSASYQLQPGYYAEIKVTDTGIGMTEAVQQQIFDPFFTTKEKGRGTGLGLASAYGIVKNHGGTIIVNSDIGKGSTFTIYLPVSNKAVDKKDRSKEKPTLGSERILLVDDEEMIIDVGQAMLEKLGYRTLIAKDGEEAMGVVSEMGSDISLVLLDLIMPGMGGGQVFDRIRELYPDIPVILASGYAIDGDAAEIMQRGCNGFIQKPYNIQELSQKIRQTLDKVSDPDQK